MSSTNVHKIKENHFQKSMTFFNTFFRFHTYIVNRIICMNTMENVNN